MYLKLLCEHKLSRMKQNQP